MESCSMEVELDFKRKTHFLTLIDDIQFTVILKALLCSSRIKQAQQRFCEHAHIRKYVPH